jgi:uncharacterized protein YoaH (UPF0181 family)
VLDAIGSPPVLSAGLRTAEAVQVVKEELRRRWSRTFRRDS